MSFPIIPFSVESWIGHDMCGLLKAMLNVSYPSQLKTLWQTIQSTNQDLESNLVFKIALIQTIMNHK